eukprot:g48391.t1
MNEKELSKQKDEGKHIKESDEQVVVSKSGSADNIHVDVDQKLRNPSEEKAIPNCLYIIVSKSDNKTPVSSNSSDSPVIEQSQDVKPKDHSKVKEEKGDEKGKEKRRDSESFLSKSRDNIQEDTKGHEKNKEKRNEAEIIRPKFKENSQEDINASEKVKEKQNNSENPYTKFQGNMHEYAKSHEKSKEKKNEVEQSRAKFKEIVQDDKGKEKRNDSERSRSRSKESVQEDVKRKERRIGSQDAQNSEAKSKLENLTSVSKENVKPSKGNGTEERNEPENDQPESEAYLQETLKSSETEKKNYSESSESILEDRQMKDIDETDDTGKNSANLVSSSKEKVQADQCAEKGTGTSSSQLKSEESMLDTKGIGHDDAGDLKVEAEKFLKSEDKLEERNEAFESGTISADTPTLNDASLQHPVASIAQFVHYNPSSPATPTLDENFSYEACSGSKDVVESSVEDSEKQKACTSENIKQVLCKEQQAEELESKYDSLNVKTQELPVQQDVVSEIITSAICEWKDEAA